MGTLYIRDVSEETTAVLKARAAARGQSLSAYAGAELTRLAARPTNDEVVTRLRARDRTDAPTVIEILDARDTERR
ncbi:MAG: antitoxin [Micrococcus sp.]|nr:antitoxin [Micrococcus sp.]